MNSRKFSAEKTEAFEEFKKEFREWQQTLQIIEYRIDFVLKKLRDDYANIDIEEKNKIATVNVSVDHIGKFPHEVAKHEAIHLFLSSLTDMAKDRFINEKELDVEEERLVKILEQLI